MTAWRLWVLFVVQGGREVLRGADLSVEPGEVVGVLGPNGAGKTTLLRAGLGLIPLAYGSAELFDTPVARLSPDKLAELAGYLPQERQPAWNLAAWRIAALGAVRAPAAEARVRALQVLQQIGLGDLAERGVLDMSGGERARVLLARLLVTNAPLLVADEPAAGLDPEAQFLILERLRAAAGAGAAVVVTLHDLTLAARCCDRIVVLKDGVVAAEGAPREALTSTVLQSVFGLAGTLVDTPAGLVVAAGRAQGEKHG